MSQITLGRGNIPIIHAQMFYNGHWWNPERLMLQALTDESQKDAEGFIRISAKRGLRLLK